MRHVPVLLQEAIKILKDLTSPFETGCILDATFGRGGHTSEILSQFPKTFRVLGMDRDLKAIEAGKQKFLDEIQSGRLQLVHSAFSQAGSFVPPDLIGVIADLGFSSDQLDDPDRGLSFLKEGPLDMRMDQSQGETCKELLNHWTEEEIHAALRDYGQERFALRIAKKIVETRKQGQLPSTTKELSQLIVQAFPRSARHGRLHAATRTFQALRIAVNQELGELDALLNHVLPLIQSGGRAVIISFHSLEDRRVKRFFKESSYIEPLFKKPIQPSRHEQKTNRRSRSAKLRAAKRL